MDDDQRSDEELAGAAGGGDETAFAELYHRYFSSIYDFALRLSRDRDAAALVVQSTFLRVYQDLRQGGPQASFRLRLYAGAHHDVAERLRSRRDSAPDGEEAFAVADPSRLATAVSADELPDIARLAWEAALGMRLNDYELLDLSLRQGLTPGEIASVLRARPATIESRLVGAHDAYQESFSALVLFHRGRRECLDLDFLIGDDDWSPVLQRRVVRHLESCQLCREAQARYPTAGDILAAFLPVPAPSGWEGTMLDRLQEAVRTGAPAAPASAASAPPPQRPVETLPEPSGGGGMGGWFSGFFAGGGARGPLLGALAGGLLAVVVVLAALCTAGTFDGDDDASPTGSPTITVTPSPSGTATLTATPSATASPEPQQPQPTEPPAPTATSPPTATTPPTVAPSPSPVPTAPAPSPTSPPAPTPASTPP